MCNRNSSAAKIPEAKSIFSPSATGRLHTNGAIRTIAGKHNNAINARLGFSCLIMTNSWMSPKNTGSRK